MMKELNVFNDARTEEKEDIFDKVQARECGVGLGTLIKQFGKVAFEVFEERGGTKPLEKS